MEITGTALNYLVVCPRKMWFFANGISMERGNEYVEMGKLADKTSFSYNRRQISLGPIVIDVVKQERGEVILFEIKRTSRLGESGKLQLLYYLWYLKHNYDQTFRGVLSYPKERKREVLKLGPKETALVENAIERAKEITSSPNPPPVSPKNYCKKCAYYDFCMV